jgi:hypothetical protein
MIVMSSNKFRPHLFIVSLLILVSLAVVPLHANAQIPVTGDLSIGLSSPLPANPASLAFFIQQVKNDSAQKITGLYMSNLFSFPVIQQPGDQPAFVSPADDQVTQFQSASAFGSLGFVAHNTLAGKKFSEIKTGDLISVVYGDGHYTQFQVSQIRRLQALQPNNPYSSFIDLSNHRTLSVEDIFYQTYGVNDRLVLQTCITVRGLGTWGRLFVIAVPYTPVPFRTFPQNFLRMRPL